MRGVEHVVELPEHDDTRHAERGRTLLLHPLRAEILRRAGMRLLTPIVGHARRPFDKVVRDFGQGTQSGTIRTRSFFILVKCALAVNTSMVAKA